MIYDVTGNVNVNVTGNVTGNVNVNVNEIEQKKLAKRNYARILASIQHEGCNGQGKMVEVCTSWIQHGLADFTVWFRKAAI